MRNTSPSTRVEQGLSALEEFNSDDGSLFEFSNKSPKPGMPNILLTTTLRWLISARLAIAFSAMGCRVEIVCPRQHPAATTRAVRRIYPHSALKPLASLRAAISAAAPDFIIPCDDNAAIQLHQLYSHLEPDPSMNSMRELIWRSLGTPEACSIATERGQLLRIALEEGVRIPETTIVSSIGELDAWLALHKFPAVIKIDCSWGGQGVAIIRNNDDARSAFKRMTSRPGLVNTVARMLLERDTSFFRKFLKEVPGTVTVQKFISGVPANRAVACWQGKVLAGISVEALKTQHPTGPATVVRVIENAEMSEAVVRLVRRLGISGLWGIDFIIEASTGAAYLIEVNPRATPVCHLPLGETHNLLTALYTQLTGMPPGVAPAVVGHDVIAMFPSEWHRNPASHFLRFDYHDVPWGEPGLIRECIDKPWSERGLIARFWARTRPKRPTQPEYTPLRRLPSANDEKY